MWEYQADPFSGDVSNSYNDGPPSEGAKPLGPFYELESSSPALALQPGESSTHMHRTMHLTGEFEVLATIAKHSLGVDLETLSNGFPL
jgi:hypothetical protein